MFHDSCGTWVTGINFHAVKIKWNSGIVWQLSCELLRHKIYAMIVLRAGSTSLNPPGHFPGWLRWVKRNEVTSFLSLPLPFPTSHVTYNKRKSQFLPLLGSQIHLLSTFTEFQEDMNSEVKYLFFRKYNVARIGISLEGRTHRIHLSQNAGKSQDGEFPLFCLYLHWLYGHPPHKISSIWGFLCRYKSVAESLRG